MSDQSNANQNLTLSPTPGHLPSPIPTTHLSPNLADADKSKALCTAGGCSGRGRREVSQTAICMEGLEKAVLPESNANEKNESAPSGGERHSKNPEEAELEFAPSAQQNVTGNKVALMTRIIPMSRKSSQVVPSSDQAGTVVITFEDPSPKAERTAAEETGIKTPCLNSVKFIAASDIKEGSGTPGTPGNPDVKDNNSAESVEEVCRICHDNPSRMTLLSPCLCKGSMGKVHRVCLERWLGESAKTSCEICGHEYETERRPRYTGWRSVVAWIRNPLAPTDTRNLFFDLACFFILTPLAAISAWLCVVGAKHYSFGQTTLNPDGTQDLPAMHDEKAGLRSGHQNKLRNKSIEASNSTWTSIGLLTLTGTLLAAYYVWLFVAVRYHIQVWREWQARNFVVTISPLNPERVRQLQQLREATAMLEAAVEHHQPQPEVTTGQNSGTTTNPNTTHGNNNNNNNNNSESSDDSSCNAKAQSANYSGLKRLRERTLARAFEETPSMDSSGTISDGAPCSTTVAGPSSIRTCRQNNSDVDSVQGKVIVIPSEASYHLGPER